MTDNRISRRTQRQANQSIWPFTAATCLLLAACGSPKEAGKASFLSALQRWLDQHPECVNIGTMPATLRAHALPAQRQTYEALVAAGLLSVESRRVEQPPLMGQTMSYDARVYRPAGPGVQAISKSNDKLLGGSDLCFAHRVVSEATSFTEPADVMGLRVSQVRYTYRLDDIAPWAKNPVVRAALPKLARVIDAPQGDDEASLILTSEGWQHERNVTQ